MNFQWSSRHVRIRNELFILSAIIYLAGVYGTQYNPEGVLPIKLVRQIPEGSILFSLRLLWTYFFISLIVLTWDELSNFNAFRTNLDEVTDKLQKISEQMNAPDTWSEKILPHEKVKALDKRISEVIGKLDDAVHDFNQAEFSQLEDVIFDETYMISETVSNSIHTDENQQWKHIYKKMSDQLKTHADSIKVHFKDYREDIKRREAASKEIRNEYANISTTLEQYVTEMKSMMENGLPFEVDFFGERTEKATKSIQDLHKSITRGRTVMAADRWIMSVIFPILASLLLLAGSFYPADPVKLSPNNLINSPPFDVLDNQ